MNLPKDLQPVVELIHRALLKTGQQPDQIRDDKQENEARWKYLHGSAPIEIRLFKHPDSDSWYIEVSSAFMELPPLSRRPEFYEQLLRLNLRYPAVTFAIDDTQALLKSDREVRGLDVRELSMMLHRISLISDHYDDQLRLRYNEAQ